MATATGRRRKQRYSGVGCFFGLKAAEALCFGISPMPDRRSVAVQALADAQKRGLDALTQAAAEADDAPKPPDDTIEPVITDVTPDPLFSTNNDFVTASRNLERFPIRLHCSPDE